MANQQSAFSSLLDDEVPALASKASAKKSSSARSALAWLMSDQAKLIGGAAALLAACILLGYQLFGGTRSADAMSRHRDMVCSETLEPFPDVGVPDGEDLPFRNPKTGRRTLYPAEKCYWNKDGSVRLQPTFVLLNDYVGKPGQTICPDCGRPVVGHNPMPPFELLIEAGKQAGGKK